MNTSIVLNRASMHTEELAAVRAEIKSWERKFKQENSCDPTIEDIKKQPAITEKYRLYKRLSKATKVMPTPVTASSNAPFTPPRPMRSKITKSSLIISASHPVESTVPLSNFNPFSPQKKDKRKRHPDQSRQSLRNPFASPVKTKPDIHELVSPVHYNSVNPPMLFSLTTSSPPLNAVSKARKRLRGEPVSPSPNKDKRRRVGSQSTILPFPKLNMCDADSDEDAEYMAANSSFVDDSPVKNPASGKSFKLLFEERITSNCQPVGIKPTSKNTKGNNCVFPTSREWLKSTEKDNDNLELPLSSSSNTIILKPKKALSPAMDQLFSMNKNGKSEWLQGETSRLRVSSKRTISDVEPSEHHIVKPRLLPPSPPSADSGRVPPFHVKKDKGGRTSSKSSTSRKRTNEKVENEESDGTDEPVAKLKILRHVRPNSSRAFHLDDDLEADGNALFGYPRLTTPHAQGFLAETDEQHTNGKFEVDLPEKLRRVLAIAPQESKSRDSLEERVVKSLIYGKRIGNYNESRGGEIWGVGEDGALSDEQITTVDAECEDDWEGEPIPWEVGEL